MGYFGHNNTPKLESSDFRYTQNNLDQNGKKQKEVYPTLAGLCHAWASGNVLRGRSGSSMFFEQGTIYSYGYHYQAAKIYTNEKGEKLVLINSKDYSNSTANHISEIKSATSHIKNIRVPTIRDLDHDENLKYFSNLIADEMALIFQARSSCNVKRVIVILKRMEQYCAFFGIKMPFKMNEETLSLLKECDKISTQKSVSREKKRKENEAKKEAALKEEHKALLEKLESDFPFALEKYEDNDITANDLYKMVSLTVTSKGAFGHNKRHYLNIDVSKYEDRITEKFKKDHYEDVRAFRAGEISAYSIEDTLNLSSLRIDLSTPYALLRVKGNKVETSRGADVPLNHAIRLLKLIQNNDAKKGERVGLFTLEEVKDDPKGDRTVVIGCHKILLSEAVSVLSPYMNDPKLELVSNEVEND